MPVYKLFSWEHSYFSGKVRAYLRFKHRHDALGAGFEDILATPELIQGLLLPKSGSGAVPQIQTPDGTWIQDSSEILDYCEAAHPGSGIVPSPASRPVQCLAAYLIELLADEWLLVPGFWERWYYSEDGRRLSHRGFNEQQWGAVIAAGAPGEMRRQAGAGFFEAAFGISTSRSDPKGVYAGLLHLGVNEETEGEWQASQHRFLERFEEHLRRHDYVFGGTPSLADFGLLAPLYAHLYRDAVAGFALRTHFPLVCEWVERTNGEGALNSRMETQQLYSVGEDGELVGRPATSDGAAWLPDDEIPETLIPILQIFFDEMWPVLASSIETLTRYIESAAHDPGGELPGKSFSATPGFEGAQIGDGPLTHSFEIGGVLGRRMVIPYQIWMLQRIEGVIQEATTSSKGRDALDALLQRFPRGSEILELSTRLEGCRVRKQGALLYAEH